MRDDADRHPPAGDNKVVQDIAARYTDAAQEFPSEDLDSRILAAAHRAVGAKPRDVATRSPLRRWSVPLSVAATLLLSVTLVTTMLREQHPPETPAAADSSNPAPAQRPDSVPRTDSAPGQTRMKEPGAARSESKAAPAMTVERDPERWLQDIEARLGRGDTDAALRELRAFRQRNPGYPVSASLRELIEDPGRGNPESPHPAQ